jgi:hypothetical protein
MLGYMKCSNCGNDMVRSKAGWLCMECGHVVALTDVDKVNAEAAMPNVLASAAPEQDVESSTVEPNVNNASAGPEPLVEYSAPSIEQTEKPPVPEANALPEADDITGTKLEVKSRIQVKVTPESPAKIENDTKPELESPASEPSAVSKTEVSDSQLTPEEALKASLAEIERVTKSASVHDTSDDQEVAKNIEPTVSTNAPAMVDSPVSPDSEPDAPAIVEPEEVNEASAPNISIASSLHDTPSSSVNIASPDAIEEQATQAEPESVPVVETDDDDEDTQSQNKVSGEESDPMKDDKSDEQPKDPQFDLKATQASAAMGPEAVAADPVIPGIGEETQTHQSPEQTPPAITNETEPIEKNTDEISKDPQREPVEPAAPSLEVASIPSAGMPVVEATPAPEAETALPHVPTGPQLPTNEPADAPVSLVVTPSADVVNATPVGAKPALQPVTHPQPLNGTQIALLGGIVLVALIGGVIAYSAIAGPTAFSRFSSKSAAATPISTPKPVLGASDIATPTPAPDPAAVDAQRRADLTSYASAYKATAQNGFFATSAPAISYTANDPVTQLPYQIVNSLPASGEIRYWAGGSCTGTSVKPGSKGTRYLALQIPMAGSDQPYCLDVK